jgi:indolepyruvate ferredoxin oxidoreductase
LKREFGPWIRQAMSVLAKFRFLRGTALDPFGHTRRAQDRAAVDRRLQGNGDQPARHAVSQQPGAGGRDCRIPEHIRGYGHVKERHLVEAKTREAMLVGAYKAGKSRAPVYMAAE